MALTTDDVQPADEARNLLAEDLDLHRHDDDDDPVRQEVRSFLGSVLAMVQAEE